LLTSEDPAFALDPQPIEVDAGAVRFRRAGAVMLRAGTGNACDAR
jgi:hypothetical protein